jgi:hypothetical protein
VDGFEIRTGEDFVHIWLEEVFGFPDKTSHFGGYEARGKVDIHCGRYRVCGSLLFSTGEVWQFYTELLKVYNDLTGQAQFRSSEGNLELMIRFRARGHLNLEGTYQEHNMNKTRLLFEIESDQSYLTQPLTELAQFVAKYGDNRGLPR